MKIQPITSWQNGEQKQANNFSLESRFDNLKDSAIFKYNLSKIDEDGSLVDVIANGELTINDQDYKDWSSASDINFWAYAWAAQKLNLVLVSE